MMQSIKKYNHQRKPGPRLKRLDTRFRGVYYRPKNNAARPYVAWVCHNSTTIHLGEFAEETQAAQVADLARYILFGIKYENWPTDKKRHRKPNPPNFQPLAKLPISPIEIKVIFHKLNHHGWLDLHTMSLRILDYLNPTN